MDNPGAFDFAANAAYVWLAAGVVFMLAEALGASGIGFLFAGLGALVVGAAVQLNVVNSADLITQLIVFFAATALWARALWKPLQKIRLGKQGGGYSNIVGDTAYVGSNGITKQSGGEVTWSGTIMKAQLSPHASVDRLDAGAQVVIAEIKGATLIVRPKE